MADKIKLTVWLSTYNQEPYVAQALDSILMQKTDFPFEIVAADDCSTDRTQEIILDYQRRWPDKIITYFTPENVGGCRKLTGCIDAGLFRGDYLSYLEGDDYWLGEDRLQTLVDFLEAHPEYSRISHRRKVIDENEAELGYDTSEDVLEKVLTIEDFLEGKLYSDFGSVFRNYFKTAGSKYHKLFWASRNVCDYQDMFITQDFGPVYVTSRCLSVYRSRSTAGATNYNSVTSMPARRRDSIRIAKAVEEFYQGRYDLSPQIFRDRLRLMTQAVSAGDEEELKRLREEIPPDDRRKILTELEYLARRGNRRNELDFMSRCMNEEEKKGQTLRLLAYALRRVLRKLSGRKINEKLRGYVNRN